MKHIIIILLLFGALSAGGEVIYRNQEQPETARLVAKDGRGTVLEMNTPGLEVIDSDLDEHPAGIVFRIPAGGGFLATIGAPDLPVVRRMVQVPARGDITVEIISSESSALGIYSIAPYQIAPTYSGPAPEYTIDNAIYSTDEFYPSSTVSIESVQILRDIRVAWVRFSPVQVNPVTGEVILTTSVTVRVSSGEEQGENELQRIPSGRTRSFLPLYEEVIGFDTDGDIVDGSYVFIGTSETIGYAQDLIDWKRQKGYQVEIGLLPTIGTTASAIDAWIENAYNTWPNKPEYIMLVGDEIIVPSTAYTYNGNPGVTDNKYGVIGAGCVPSIHVSRICGNDISDLSYIAWKIRMHEMNPYQVSGSSWFNKAVSLNCDLFEAPQEGLYLHQLFQASALESKFYCPALGGIPPTLAAFVNDINEGLSVISYIGHGDVTEFSTTGFSNSDVAALTNGRKMPWIWSVGCLNGKFDGEYCIMEALLSEGSVSDAKGAITCMGSATYTPVGAGDSLGIHTFKGYFEQNIHHLGAAYTYGKNKIYEFYGANAVDMNMMGTVFGCAETDIYTDTSPIAYMTNSHSTTAVPGSFQVTVTDNSKAVVEGALVGLYYADTKQTLASGYTNSSGVVDLNISSLPGSSTVTVTSTAHNRVPCVSYANSTGIENSGGTASGLEIQVGISRNPVYGSVVFSVSVPMSGAAELSIYDLTGRKVETLCNDELSAGAHSFSWQPGCGIASGIYFVRLSTPAGSAVRQMMVVR
ncbi:MAG: T9SS type A sorting domain-containing protein [Candidatus Aegiribacteria sp.]|nr:T9SS type A sorting domain-containing protein [Candidatus Aegiribacteria sp.]